MSLYTAENRSRVRRNYTPGGDHDIFLLLLRSSPLIILPPDHCRVKRRRTLVNSNPACSVAHIKKAVDEERFSFHASPVFCLLRQEPSFKRSFVSAPLL